MLYTIKDIKDRIDELDSEEYVSVSIDGIPRGIAIVTDLKEQIYEYGNRAGKRRIKQMFLSGVTYDVKKGINLYPVPKEDFWRELGGDNMGELKNTPISDIADKRPRDIFGRTHDGMVRIDSNDKEEPEAEPVPLVKWDAAKGIIHFREDAAIGKRIDAVLNPYRNVKQRVSRKSGYRGRGTPKLGLVERIKRWLKGDKEFKR